MSDLQHRLCEHLRLLYPFSQSTELAEKLMTAMGVNEHSPAPPRHRNLWSEQDSVLITYGDTIVDEHRLPLQVLKSVLDQYFKHSFNTVHILPFFPYSSDDGFSVMDYLAVNPALGDWADIERIAQEYTLMADVVINHISSRSRWFDNYKKRLHPGCDYFFEASPDDDLSAVVRPRNSPLLTAVETADGLRHVWCTFSSDQVDFDFSNPQVLVEFANIIRHYIDWGVRVFRLDAVAFLWKRVGGECIHLQETHEVIKLLRTLIEHKCDQAVVITETNVPNRENLTYFGNANEAHVIYNFSLPPLLLYTLVSGNCRHLKTWLMSMPPAQAGTAYLNFIASHDGIGLRPLDGLVDVEHRDELIALMQSFGGHVSSRKSREGSDEPYEINIALFDALKGTIANGPDHWQLQRFICAHAIMLALEGIPAFYIHSLLATENDYNRVKHTGRARSINRHVWALDELQQCLADENSHHHRAYTAISQLIALRKKQPAFHPNATQFTLHLGLHVFAFWRQSIGREQSIFCLNNISDREQLVTLSDINLISVDSWTDLITGQRFDELDSQLLLAPYQTVWLSNRPI